MNYTEGIIRRTEFFTTAELAEKLKMNVQVITRKVQAGEIMAYKIGKEWRIPEQSVLEWLEANSNSGSNGGSKSEAVATRESRPRRSNDQSGSRKDLLEYILAQFEPNHAYTEDQVNGVVARYHEDPATVRRDLISAKMMERRNGHYRRCADYKLSG